MTDQPGIRLLLGDAIEQMQALSGSVTTIIADLPYGTTQNAWDEVIPFRPMWREFWRLCPQGTVVLTAMQPFVSALVMSQPQFFRHDWIWEKNKATGHLNAKNKPMLAHEHVLVFSRKPPLYNPQMTEGHKPGNYAMQRTYTPNYGAQTPTEYGGSTQRYPRSVQKFPVVNNNSQERLHPTQKPTVLMEYLVKTYSNKGDIILDCCMGSGTTGVAAKRLGRGFIGIESEVKYFTIAERRIAEAML